LRSVVASLEEKVRDGRISAPADGNALRFAVRVGDYVKVGDLLAEMEICTRSACALLLTSPNSVAWSPANLCASLGTRFPIATGWAKTQVIPKQVVARGARSVGELLCEVNNDKLDCCQYQCERAHQFPASASMC